MKKFVSAAYCIEDETTKTKRYLYLKQGEKLSLYDGRWEFKQISESVEIGKIWRHGKEVGWKRLIDGEESTMDILGDEDKENLMTIRLIDRKDYHFSEDGRKIFDPRKVKYFKRLKK